MKVGDLVVYKEPKPSGSEHGVFKILGLYGATYEYFEIKQVFIHHLVQSWTKPENLRLATKEEIAEEMAFRITGKIDWTKMHELLKELQEIAHATR